MSDPSLHSFQPPPPPSFHQTNSPAAPTLSTAETLTGIFFEPGRVFEALRERPRFLAAALITVVAFLIFNSLYFQRIGYENVIRAETEASPRAASTSPADKERAIEFQTKPVFRAFRYLSPILIFAIFFAAGAGLYLLGSMMMARTMSYKQALSVWTYSSFPPTVLLMLLNIIVLFLKPPDDDITIARGARGLVHANPGLLVDPTASPVLATALGAFDVFAFYGLFLAALGLRKVGRLSSGAAWGIVITIWLIGVILRIVGAVAFNTAMA